MPGGPCLSPFPDSPSLPPPPLRTTHHRRPPSPPSQDNLVMASIRFLTTVSRSVHYTLFSSAGALQQICEKVVVPNLATRPEDQEVGAGGCGEGGRRGYDGEEVHCNGRL